MRTRRREQKLSFQKGEKRKLEVMVLPPPMPMNQSFFHRFFIIIPRIGDGTTPKRALLQGEDDGEGHKWKVLRGRGGEINVFYGRGSASQLQLRKEDKKVDAHRAARPQKQAKAG